VIKDEEILAIAGQLWKQEPAFTMDQLADETRISRATLYRRFGSREAILQRLVDEQAIDAPELSRPDIPTRILYAARTIFSRFGLEGVTVEQIAQEAGVGPATIYRHFGSKDALIQEFAKATKPRQLLQSFTIGQPSDLEADLVTLAMTLLEFVDEHPAFFRIMLFEKLGHELLREQLRATQGRTVSSLAEYLAAQMAAGNIEQGDPFDLALAFIGMVFGLAFVGPYSYERPIKDREGVARLVARVFLHGVAQPHLQKLEKEL
jgi:AcrR family transcriptional regulator